MPRHLLRVTSISLLALFAAAALANGAPKKNDNVPGARWTYTITQGDKKESGTFRILELVIYKDDKKIGRATQKSTTETTLVFTGLPELNGTAEVKRVKRGSCTGTLKKSDGTEWVFKAHVAGD
jgi:hypothetical protein